MERYFLTSKQGRALVHELWSKSWAATSLALTQIAILHLLSSGTPSPSISPKDSFSELGARKRLFQAQSIAFCCILLYLFCLCLGSRSKVAQMLILALSVWGSFLAELERLHGTKDWTCHVQSMCSSPLSSLLDLYLSDLKNPVSDASSVIWESFVKRKLF